MSRCDSSKNPKITKDFRFWSVTVKIIWCKPRISHQELRQNRSNPILARWIWWRERLECFIMSNCAFWDICVWSQLYIFILFQDVAKPHDTHILWPITTHRFSGPAWCHPWWVLCPLAKLVCHRDVLEVVMSWKKYKERLQPCTEWNHPDIIHVLGQTFIRLVGNSKMCVDNGFSTYLSH